VAPSALEGCARKTASLQGAGRFYLKAGGKSLICPMAESRIWRGAEIPDFPNGEIEDLSQVKSSISTMLKSRIWRGAEIPDLVNDRIEDLSQVKSVILPMAKSRICVRQNPRLALCANQGFGEELKSLICTMYELRIYSDEIPDFESFEIEDLARN
jgi:hypothetical protein